MEFNALAFCGGGAKGAFHIGMWKALLNFHYAEKIKAVSGTSVGALNAVLFALGDYKKARDIWYSIEPEMFLSPTFGINIPSEDALFSRNGLIQIINNLDLSHLKIDVYVNVYNTETSQIESHKLNKYDNAKKCQYLLAATALPLAYENVIINNKTYCDSGFTSLGNTPISPLYKSGYHNIIVGSLDHTFNPYHVYDSIIKNPYKKVSFDKQYPNCNIKSIWPSKDLGNLFSGTLNFSKAAIRSKMIQGYQDTKKILNKEDFFNMKNNYSKINLHIYNKMSRLFKNSTEIDLFIRVTNFSNINIPLTTLDKTIWYEDIVKLFGWKVQQNKLLGFQSYYRILDPNNVRRAWVNNPDDLLRALDDYEAVNEFNS